MLTDHVIAEVFCLHDIIFQSLVGRRRIKPVRPPALIQRSVHEDWLAIEAKQFSIAIFIVHGNFPQRRIAFDCVQDFASAKNLNLKAIQIRRIRRP